MKQTRHSEGEKEVKQPKGSVPVCTREGKKSAQAEQFLNPTSSSYQPLTLL